MPGSSHTRLPPSTNPGSCRQTPCSGWPTSLPAAWCRAAWSSRSRCCGQAWTVRDRWSGCPTPVCRRRRICGHHTLWEAHMAPFSLSGRISQCLQGNCQGQVSFQFKDVQWEVEAPISHSWGEGAPVPRGLGMDPARSLQPFAPEVSKMAICITIKS